jgi:predicted transcriptional regulator
MDESLFREFRIEKRLTTRELADRWGCSRSTVSRWEEKHGLDKTELKPWTDRERMLQLYEKEEKTADEISEIFECSRSTVLRWLKKHEINVRTPMHTYDDAISSGGYQFVRYWKNGMLYGMRVHRLVAYAHKMIDFDELFDPSVVVHHKNDIALINNPENLEVMRRGEHSQHHFDEIQSS